MTDIKATLQPAIQRLIDALAQAAVDDHMADLAALRVAANDADRHTVREPLHHTGNAA